MAVKRVLVVALAGIGLLAVAAGVNTALSGSRQLKVAPAPALAIDENAAAQRLAESLRFTTISDATDADANAAEFDKLHAHLQASFPRLHAALKREDVGSHALLYTWQGSDPKAAPVMWMAHQDVVPIAPGTEKDWTQQPFSGVVADGFVWGRGAWDDKGNLYAQMEAIEMLVASGYQPKRTIYLAFGADEEVGGTRGAVAIAALMKSRGVKLDYVLDEGLLVLQGVVPGLQVPAAMIGVAEKGYASYKLDLSTAPGHSSMPPPQTAIGMMSKALADLEANQMPVHMKGLPQTSFEILAPEMSGFNRVALSNFWLFSPVLERVMVKTPSVNALMRTTTALTMVNAGVKDNVLPGSASATVNFRLLPGDTLTDVKDHMRKVIGNDAIRISDATTYNAEASHVASVDGVAYGIVNRTVREVFPDAVVAPGLMVAATDSRHFEAVSDNILKFGPVRATSEDLPRFHGTNERMSVKNYGDMIRFYHQLARNSNS
ncbi:M20 family peptidase [Pseudoduganella sp. RAF19]|uniref:M20 family peptidase n=1 Tax=Pseudoduganella sp. RAF19 TaxID=3233052 RepID=UPI003F9BF724